MQIGPSPKDSVVELVLSITSNLSSVELKSWFSGRQLQFPQRMGSTGSFYSMPHPAPVKEPACAERNCYVHRGNCPSRVSSTHWGWENYVHNPGLIKHFLVLPWPVITINGQLWQPGPDKSKATKGSNLSGVSSPISHSCSLGSLSKVNHLLTSPCLRFCSLLLKLLSH